MRTLRKTIVAFMLALCILPLAAEEGTKLTYDDLKDSLTLNNPDILQAIEDHRTASLDVKDAKANYHPQISYTLAGSYVYDHQVMPMPIKDMASGMVGDFGDAGIVVTFPGTGTIGPIGPSDVLLAVPINSLVDQMPDNYDFAIDTNAPYFNAQLSLVQPIWTWGKIGASVDMYEEIEQARALQITDTEMQLDVQLKAYLASLYYLEQIDGILAEMESDAAELVALAEGSTETGIMLATDAAEARLTARQLELSRTQIQNQISTILVSLENMTGIEDITLESIDFTPDEAFFMEIANADRNLLEVQATSNSSLNMQMLNHMLSATESAKSAADRSMYWFPDIALSVSANYTAPMNSNWVSQSGWGVTVAVGIQGSIWDGGKKLNDQDRAESAVASAQIARTEAVNTIKSTLNDNFTSIDLALANISYQDANIALLEEELSNEELKLELGAGSRSDVLQKRIELGQARIERLTNYITLAASAYTVDYMTSYTGQ